MKTYKHLFERIVSFENLLAAYKTFRRGKRFKEDVLKFEYNYETELLKYGIICKKIDEIGRMLGGWIKVCAKA